VVGKQEATLLFPDRLSLSHKSILSGLGGPLELQTRFIRKAGDSKKNRRQP
jgi:hypothetical protein